MFHFYKLQILKYNYQKKLIKNKIQFLMVYLQQKQEKSHKMNLLL